LSVFIDGFLALCPTVGTGVCTEPTVAGYSRQPISFSASIKGTALSAGPFTFGPVVTSSGTFAGRAIYDAPSAGNLLVVLPFPSARPPSARLSDAGDVGAIRLMFDALATYPNGDAFSGTFALGASVGQWYDDLSLNVPWMVQVSGGRYVPSANTMPITAGVALTITRGILRAS